MSEIRIAVLVGSLRRESHNQRLARALERLAPPHVHFHRVEIGDLPPYNQDEEKRPAPPVQRFKREIAEAHGVLFVTPEYNRSVPGVLKNAIDHGSRPYGESVWAGKPAAVIGVSIGAIGTAVAQQHLRSMLAYLDMPALAQPEVFLHYKDGLFTHDGQIGDASREFLQGWMDRFVEWVSLHARDTHAPAALSRRDMDAPRARPS